MATVAIRATVSDTPVENAFRVTWFCFAITLLVMALIPPISHSQTQQSAKPVGFEPTPEAAVPAILAAFDTYEVVGMPAAHGMKDMDDFIFSLLRNPALPEKLNDIAVECGNSLYQPVLDRYISGEDVRFSEVRKVWRNTTEEMCGSSGFYEQLFPLVRTINQTLPPGKRLRVLAADSPVDWDRVKAIKDAPEKYFDRDGSIASVMESEVLSKHRKALMLFGTHHLMHGTAHGAVATYEKDYPNVTLVIANLAFFSADLAGLPRSPFAAWPIPSLVLAKGTWLGAFDMSHFSGPMIRVDKDCNVFTGPPKEDQKPMAEQVDAFLYLGPPELALKEHMPADIALDSQYMKELLRRQDLMAWPGKSTITLKKYDEQVVREAENPMFEVQKPPDSKEIMAIRQSCLDRQKQSTAPK